MKRDFKEVIHCREHKNQDRDDECLHPFDMAENVENGPAILPVVEGNHNADVDALRREMEQLQIALAAAVCEKAARDQQTKLNLPPPLKLLIDKDDPLICVEKGAHK